MIRDAYFMQEKATIEARKLAASSPVLQEINKEEVIKGENLNRRRVIELEIED